MAENRFVQSVIVLVFFSLLLILTSSSQLFGTKAGMAQMPSETTDFPGDNPNIIKADVTSAKKDAIGFYHVKGVIKNLVTTL